jgi:TPR repeat protein
MTILSQVITAQCLSQQTIATNTPTGSRPTSVILRGDKVEGITSVNANKDEKIIIMYSGGGGLYNVKDVPNDFLEAWGINNIRSRAAVEPRQTDELKQLTKDAEQGDSTAQLRLGCNYLQGHGVVRNEIEAANWFRKAADQNNAQAQLLMGQCYAEGTGVTNNEVEAAKWFQKAADQNLAKAQHKLAACYHEGIGVMKDYAEALKWTRKAADQNYAEAQYNLGLCYGHGEGVATDEVEAVKWFRKAAEQNAADAQCELGRCYAFGLGVAQNYVESYKWVLLAVWQGDENAKKAARMLRASMTQAQTDKGQELANSFKSRMDHPY